jgi:hypothetical protein
MTTQKTNKYMHGRNINKQIIKTEQARHMTESLGTRLELLSFLSIIIKITDRVSHKTQLINNITETAPREQPAQSIYAFYHLFGSCDPRDQRSRLWLSLLVASVLALLHGSWC